MPDLVYKPGGQVLKDFLRDDHFFRGLRGPVGSGKSAACCIEVFRRACLQKPGPDGIRRSKWAIIRNSYPQLATTTLETWLQWFPEELWGPVKMHPPPFEHVLKKGDLELTVLFLALDRPDDVKKLLSLELTGVWINEARELPKSIVDACTMRVGRYPSMKDGGPSWYGVIADTNAPDEDHWWPIMAGEAPLPDHITREDALTLVRPDSWRFFTQPGGVRPLVNGEKEVTGYELNPLAENLQNLTPDYYPRIIQGKGRDWIKVYVLNEFATLSDGKPVYADFDESLHVAKEPLQPIPNLPLTIGIDFGLTPSAVIAQKIRHRWLVLHEIVATDMGIVRFAELLKSDLAQRFPGFKATIWGDPSGDFRAATDETTPFQILRRAGLIARPAPTNDPALRIEAVTGTLTRLVDKQPGMLIDPRCTVLIRGYKSGYHYKRVQKTGAESFDSKPNKNQFSHVHDANQYLVCGGGESREILVGGSQAVPVIARRDFDVFNRPKPERKRSPSGRFGAL
jgi:hypothetical protein